MGHYATDFYCPLCDHSHDTCVCEVEQAQTVTIDVIIELLKPKKYPDRTKSTYGKGGENGRRSR